MSGLLNMLALILALVLVIETGAFAPFMQRIGRFHSPAAMNPLMLNKIDINMPALSSTMKEGKIVAWNKQVGDKVDAGDVLLVVESDKADMDVEAFEEGYLAAIYTPEGGVAPVGAAVAVLVENADDISKVGSEAPAPSADTAESAAPAATTTSVAPPGDAPEFEAINMPALSSTMKEGKIVSWSKQVGDKVDSGDMVLVVESDKADMDVESYEEGYLAVITVDEGGVAPVGEPVAFLAKSTDDVAKVQAYIAGGGGSAGGAPAPATGSNDASSSTSPSTPVAAASRTTSTTPAIVNDGRVAASGYAKAQAKEQGIDLRTVQSSRPDGFITSKDLASGSAAAAAGGSSHVPAPGVINASPRARQLAKENNLDVTKIKGSGNFGRVVPDDVLKAAGKYVAPPTSAAAAAPTTSAAGAKAAAAVAVEVLDGVVPMSGMQKAIAKNMEATMEAPEFRVSREIVTDEFDALYSQLKPKGITVSAMLAKAVALTLEKHPLINAAYVDGGIKYSKNVNVAMAVATEGGLITPTIFKANEKDLFTIGRDWKDLVSKAMSNQLAPKDYTGGTFVISNLGMFGVSQFDALLPKGLGSILAIAASKPQVVQMKNGHFGVQKAMTVTITCDHRHIYGADAAKFLKDLADLIENDSQSLTMG